METPNNHVFYTLLTPTEFRERLAAAPVAYLPLGTLEWHGPHLPLGADGARMEGILRSALASLANETHPGGE